MAIHYVHMWSGLAKPPAYEEAQDCVQDADIFVVIGTSLQVYPVAGLIHEIQLTAQLIILIPKQINSIYPFSSQDFPDGHRRHETLLKLLESEI